LPALRNKGYPPASVLGSSLRGSANQGGKRQSNLSGEIFLLARGGGETLLGVGVLVEKKGRGED